MILNLYSVKDRKGDFLPPAAYASDAIAKRAFAMACSETGSAMSFAPSDFELYGVGTFDTGTCHFELLAYPEFVCEGGPVHA